MEYFGDAGDRMHMMFNFQVNQTSVLCAGGGDARPLVKALKATRPGPRPRSGACFCAIMTNSISDG